MLPVFASCVRSPPNQVEIYILPWGLYVWHASPMGGEFKNITSCFHKHVFSVSHVNKSVDLTLSFCRSVATVVLDVGRQAVLAQLPVSGSYHVHTGHFFIPGVPHYNASVQHFSVSVYKRCLCSTFSPPKASEQRTVQLLYSRAGLLFIADVFPVHRCQTQGE